MRMTFSRHRFFLSIGAVAGLAALIINNYLAGERLAFAQMILWTVLVFALVAIQVKNSLWRPRQLCVALALMVLHVVVLTRFADQFPLNNMIVGFVGMGVEVVVLIFLYIRIGQSVDPKGPYGLTDAEIRERTIKHGRPSNLPTPTRFKVTHY